MIKMKEGGSSNFSQSASLKIYSPIIASSVMITAMMKLLVNDTAKSSCSFLKKSAVADWIIPNVIKGAISIILLVNKLSTPLSAGVRYFGLVNKGISKKDTPLEKKLVNTYLPTDL